jgi:hypothetical protein
VTNIGFMNIEIYWKLLIYEYWNLSNIIKSMQQTTYFIRMQKSILKFKLPRNRMAGHWNPCTILRSLQQTKSKLIGFTNTETNALNSILSVVHTSKLMHYTKSTAVNNLVHCTNHWNQCWYPLYKHWNQCSIDFIH